jgi:DNA-binding NtrC family response regulator
VTVNCGAIPENLVESTLFGHEKGAFTGATERHQGKFVEASGGTLFLDEIGELPPSAQVKLLRAIQEGEVDPVGGKRAVRVDIRLVSATNRSLLGTRQGGPLPRGPLLPAERLSDDGAAAQARREDIPELARAFLARFAAEEGKRLRGISAEAMALICRYDWPATSDSSRMPCSGPWCWPTRRAHGCRVSADRRSGGRVRDPHPARAGARERPPAIERSSVWRSATRTPPR